MSAGGHAGSASCPSRGGDVLVLAMQGSERGLRQVWRRLILLTRMRFAGCGIPSSLVPGIDVSRVVMAAFADFVSLVFLGRGFNLYTPEIERNGHLTR